MQSMPMLEDWAVVVFSKNAYVAPEASSICLIGKCTGHPILKDRSDHRVITSDLRGLNVHQRLALTQNRLYKLGEPSQEWILWLAENNHTLNHFSFNERLVFDAENSQ